MSHRHLNLILDGPEAVAAHTVEVMSKVRGDHILVARRLGNVRVFQRSKLPDSELPNIIGTYNRASLPEHIEDDCIARLREINNEASA